MSFPGWIERIDAYDVEKREGPRPNGQAYLELIDSTSRVIWHTTEGSTVDGAAARLREQFSAPHFVIGEDRIVQMRPLWAQAATVRGDNSRAWQVEVVGFSQQSLWLPPQDALEPLTTLLAWFYDTLGVPLKRPDGWRDDCSDIEGVWATTTNSRRLSKEALTFKGHVMHLEWPENTHWDQGAVRWTRLLELAEAKLRDERLDELLAGFRARRAGLVKDDSWSKIKKLGYEVVDDGVELPRPEAHAHIDYAPATHTHPAEEHTHTGTVEVS